MEIMISIHEIADQLRIELNDLYVNEITNEIASPCRLRLLNETHAKFSVPYNRCSTKTTVKIINTNLLNLE